MNRTDIILSCFLRLISIFSILLFIQTLVGLGEFEATVGAQVSMSIEKCPLTPSLPEGFEAKGPGEGVGRSILVELQWWSRLICTQFCLVCILYSIGDDWSPSVPPWKPCDPRKILRSPRPLACHTWIYNQRQSCWHIDLFNTRLLQFHLFCPFWINLFAPSPRGGGVFSMIKIMLETGVSFNS